MLLFSRIPKSESKMSFSWNGPTWLASKKLQILGTIRFWSNLKNLLYLNLGFGAISQKEAPLLDILLPDFLLHWPSSAFAVQNVAKWGCNKGSFHVLHQIRPYSSKGQFSRKTIFFKISKNFSDWQNLLAFKAQYVQSYKVEKLFSMQIE